MNTFLNTKGSPTIIPNEVIRSFKKEKEYQIRSVNNLKKNNLKQINIELKKLKKASLENKNIFECLMETSKFCSLGDVTQKLFEVGGKYRRNM